jgi:hypothetical protein
MQGGTLDQEATFKKGDVLFYREATLPAGVFNVEAVAYDTASKKASVVHGKLTVLALDLSLRMSSVLIVDHGEKLTADDMKTPDPLHMNDMLLYPNLGTPLSKQAGKLAFFTTIYTSAGGQTPKLTLKVAQGGKTLGELAADLPAPDAAGRIQFANALPLDAFPPGQYQLLLSVTDGKTRVERGTSFTVTP